MCVYICMYSMLHYIILHHIIYYMMLSAFKPRVHPPGAIAPRCKPLAPTCGLKSCPEDEGTES